MHAARARKIIESYPAPENPPVQEPPLEVARLLGIGEGTFHTIGNEFAGYLKNYCGLGPDSAVLDVGCGIGRIALPLARTIEKNGSYLGFDIMPEAISWCSRQITPLHPNFRFEVANIHNRMYNPRGLLSASEYKFPCDDASLDIVYATSVFTHMTTPSVVNYLDQIRRVLKVGGQCLLTFFILDEVSRAEMSKDASDFDFRYPLEGCYVTDRDTPEFATAYDEADLRDMFAQAGLLIREPILFGGWSGRNSHLSRQDIVLASRA